VQTNNNESSCKEKGKGKKSNYLNNQNICKLAPPPKKNKQINQKKFVNKING
jgi:hypothetical protein